MRLLNFLFCMLLGSLAMFLCIFVSIGDIIKLSTVKTLSVVFILGILLTSCHGDTENYNRDDYDIIEIEDCQYIKINSGYGGWMAHKGNCNNPIHK